jgi:hypothetical protein
MDGRSSLVTQCTFYEVLSRELHQQTRISPQALKAEEAREQERKALEKRYLIYAL